MSDQTSRGAPAAGGRRTRGVEPVVIDVSDHVVGFAIGRGLTGRSPLEGVEGNWVDVEWELGEINYAVFADDCAVLYDTMPLPELAQWMRDYLTRERGIRRFAVVLSHWHLDHIAGNSCFRDSPIIARSLTQQAIQRHREAIEAGTLWGPPPIEVVLPTITFADRLDLTVGDLELELYGFEIHSVDANLLLLPDERLLFAGDALEDSLSYVVEPDRLATHLAELDRLKTLPVDRILPQHGSPETIAQGGYPPSLIDAVREYHANLLERVHDPGYLELPVEAFLRDALAAGHGPIWEPYRAVHARNLRVMKEHYGARGRP